MKVDVLFFASLKDRAGRSRLPFELDPPATVASLRAGLADALPALATALPSALASVNREYALPDQALQPGDEVAFFPPVSGGAGAASEWPTLARVTEAALDVDGLLASITRPSTGAICLFTGVVRAVTGGRVIEHLDYEAYRPMAEAKLMQVAEEIRARWPGVQGIALVQRIGRLAPGSPTVAIACAAEHRDAGAFEAARYGIDRLKEIVPIWKKEVGPDGEVWIEGHYRPTEADRATPVV